MLGVPTAWRDLNFDCTNDPYLHTIIKKADLLLPWTVQRYTPLLQNDMDRYHDETKADIQWCKKNKIENELPQSNLCGFASSLKEGAFDKAEKFPVLPTAPSPRGLSPKATGGVRIWLTPSVKVCGFATFPKGTASVVAAKFPV